MKIINLIENTEGHSGCTAAHGLSFYVETAKHKLLLDLGPSGETIRNAQILGVDLSEVDTVILSHGHYDHSGGILPFTKLNDRAFIYMQESAVDDYYADDGDNAPERFRYIGIDKEIAKLPQVRFLRGDTRIDDELELFVWRLPYAERRSLEVYGSCCPAEADLLQNRESIQLNSCCSPAGADLLQNRESIQLNSCCPPAEADLLQNRERTSMIRCCDRTEGDPSVRSVRDKKHELPFTNRRLLVRRGEGYQRDNFCHEHFLVIHEGGRSILMSGCAHNGILNILETYLDRYGKAPDLVVSGFHLMKKTEYLDSEIREIEETARELVKYPTRFITCHCTGTAAYAVMKRIMGDQLTYVHSGEIVVETSYDA